MLHMQNVLRTGRAVSNHSGLLRTIIRSPEAAARKEFGLLKCIEQSIEGFNFKRTVYNSSYIGVEKFIKIRQAIERAEHKNYGKLKEKLENVIASTGPNQKTVIEMEDLKKMIHISSSDSDLELLVKTLKMHDWKAAPYSELNFDVQFMRLLYHLSKIDVALKLVRDKDLGFIFENTDAMLIMMNKLQLESRYQEVIDLFDLYLPKYGQLPTSKRTISKKLNQKIPINHLTLVFSSLLKLEKEKAHEKLNQYFKIVCDLDLKINLSCVLSCFIVALENGDIQLMKKIMERSDFVKTQNRTFYLNMQTILALKLNKYEEALDHIDNLLAMRLYQAQPQNGKIFKLTSTILQESVSSTEQESKLAVFMQKNKAVLKSRLLNIDLREFCLSAPEPHTKGLAHRRS